MLSSQARSNIFYHSFPTSGSRWELMYPYGGDKWRESSGFCAVLGTAVSCPTCQYHLYSWSPNVNTWYTQGVFCWPCQCMWMTTSSPWVEEPLNTLFHTTDPLIYGLWSTCNSFLLYHHQPHTSHPMPSVNLKIS